MSARSHLYVPGDKPEVLAKAIGRGADALIVDLEDAVAPAAKQEARQIVREWLATLPAAHEADVEIWVRVNPAAMGLDDISEVVAPALTGFCMAKTESVDEVRDAASLLDTIESSLGPAHPGLRLAPLLESAHAVLSAPDIAMGPRVTRLQLGEADLRADIGVTTGDDERELLYARSLAVLASAAAGIEPPVGPVSPNFRDLDALRESTMALKRMGYLGRACIHPAQAAVINEVFTPTSAEIEKAQAIVEGFDTALAAGAGVFVDADGRMVDEAIVRQARRTLSMVRA